MDVDLKEPKRRRSAGGVVIGDGGTIALVRSHRGKGWTFPKGHIDGDETDEEAALREIKEECGIHDLEFVDDLGTYERYRIGKEGTDDDFSEFKEIHLFLFAAPAHSALIPSMEIEEAKWIPFREVAEVLTHPKEKVWFASVFTRVREAIQRD
ncbi:NUDIX domain-containing protein [Patescibacteria group bacterium]|nr:NUDIX domain-containing protein [Patescibacteria group bacterium]